MLQQLKLGIRSVLLIIIICFNFLNVFLLFRYFDIRLLVSPGPRYRILHCLRGAEVSTILASVRGWLAAHPGEVVLLDLQHLYSFRARDHADLVTRLTQLFGELLCPWTQDLASRGDINVFYLVRPGPSSFAFFSRKKVGSRKFFGPKGKQNFFRGKYTL